MNYIKQVNAFNELLQLNPLHPNSQCLYHILMHINNKCNWISEFTVSNTLLMSYTGLTLSTLQRSRNNLIQKGFITYKKGSGNNAGTYKINLLYEFDQQSDQQNDQQVDQQSERQNDNKVTTLNKQKTKTKTETKIIKEKNKKEKNKKETEFDQLINQNFSDEELKKTIYDFIKMRKAIKKPLTTRGLELMIKKLYSLTTNVEEQIEILNNSIMNNWQGVFPIKQNTKKSNSKGSFDDFRELWEEAKIKDEQNGNNTDNNSFGW